MKDFIVAKEPSEGEDVRDPVQVGRITKENLREINDFFAVAHVPIVSPLARGLVLHGFRKPCKTIGKQICAAGFLAPGQLACLARTV